MTRLPLQTIDDPPKAAKELLVAAEKRNGFLPNLLRILANAPVALETYLTASSINARSSLSVGEREAVQTSPPASGMRALQIRRHSKSYWASASRRSAISPTILPMAR